VVTNVESYLEVIDQTDHHTCCKCSTLMSPRRIIFISEVKIDILLECVGCGTALPLTIDKLQTP